MGNNEALATYMDYDMWQSTLSDEFFPMDQPDEPVVMFIDAEELARICPGIPDPVESLCSAVLAELRQTDKPSIFGPIDRRLAFWRNGPQDQPPPFLPLLAVTVLAASKMRHDGKFSVSAFYPRLLSLMMSGSNDLAATGIHKNFAAVAEMWKTLDDWIDKNQDFMGPSTIRTHETFKLIGYPLSQTVLKASDRERLSGFFDRLGLDRRSNPSPERMLALLRQWMDKPRGFSRAFIDLVENGSGNPLLLAVIAKVAAAQPMAEPVVGGRIRLDLSLSIEPEDWSVSWVVPLDLRLETVELESDNGSRLSLRTPEYGSFYDVVSGSLPGSASLLNGRYRAVGAGAVLTKKSRQLWILRIDPISGYWNLVQEFRMGEPHLLVVMQSDVAEMNELLSKNGDGRHWELRRVLFPGWVVYVEVSLAGPIEISGGGLIASLGRLLTGPANSQPKLANGLELRTDVGGRHYLLGGEPDVHLPEGAPGEFVQIVLDNRLPGTRLKSNGSFFPLRLAGPFAEGKHEISVGGVTLEFFVHTLGNAAQWDETKTESIEQAEFLRTPPDAEGPEYVLCRRGREAVVWFVYPSGLVRKCDEPLVYGLPTKLGFPESYQWKVPVPEGSSWALTERAGKLSQPEKLATIPPNFGPLDGLAHAFWRRAVRETIGNPDRFWRAYLSQSMEDSIHGR